MVKEHFNVYRGVTVLISKETGDFFAKPEGKRDEMTTYSYGGVCRKIDDWFEAKEKERRPACEAPVRLYRDDVVTNATYVGTRSRGTGKHEAGHAFYDEDRKPFTLSSWGGHMLVVPNIVTDAQLEELQRAKEAIATAKKHYQACLKVCTLEVEIPRFADYRASVKTLTDTQNAMIDRIKRAMTTPMDMEV